MTFMPSFISVDTQASHEHHAYLEAELLAKRSRQSLSPRLSKLALAAPESVYKERLDAELQVLKNKGFSAYFLIVADYVQWAKDKDIAVGPGRGSGPCSLVGFALGITNIDPIKYGLPFERFVNPDKNSIPDFDLEFCADRRCEVTRYIQTKYGNDRVAQLSSDECTPLPSRLVIADRPLAELVPVYSELESGLSTTSITLKQRGVAGLVQFNAIDQKSLTVIQRTVQEIAQSGTAVDIDSIALDDEGAYQLLCKGEESNIAILDSEHYQSALVNIQPDRFEILYAAVALNFPRWLQDHIPQYVERKRNSDSIHYAHSTLASITAETYGLVLYQEQVMQIASKVAGFSMAQADTFRRALINANSENISNAKEKFIDGAINLGLPKSEATLIFDLVAADGQSYFNKSHAVAYAMIAYQTAWLKANYPREYQIAKSSTLQLLASHTC